MSFEFSGLDDFIGELKNIEKRAKEIEGDVTFDELFTIDFIKAYTNVNSLDELFDCFKKDMSNNEIADILETDEWNEYIKNNTKFTTWTDMMQEATNIWTKNKLFG